jgi:hypothetical protein
MNDLIKIAAALAILTASTGQLPRLVREVRMAQIHLIQDTKASHWGMPMMLNGTK